MQGTAHREGGERIAARDLRPQVLPQRAQRRGGEGVRGAGEGRGQRLIRGWGELQPVQVAGLEESRQRTVLLVRPGQVAPAGGEFVDLATRPPVGCAACQPAQLPGVAMVVALQLWQVWPSRRSSGMRVAGGSSMRRSGRAGMCRIVRRRAGTPSSG